MQSVVIFLSYAKMWARNRWLTCVKKNWIDFVIVIFFIFFQYTLVYIFYFPSSHVAYISSYILCFFIFHFGKNVEQLLSVKCLVFLQTWVILHGSISVMIFNQLLLLAEGCSQSFSSSRLTSLCYKSFRSNIVNILIQSFIIIYIYWWCVLLKLQSASTIFHSILITQ